MMEQLQSHSMMLFFNSTSMGINLLLLLLRNSAKEVVFSPPSCCWLVGLSTGFHKNCWTDFYQTWTADGSWSRKVPINVWCRSEQWFKKKCFYLPSLTLWFGVFSPHFCFISWAIFFLSWMNFRPCTNRKAQVSWSQTVTSFINQLFNVKFRQMISFFVYGTVQFIFNHD